MATESAIGRGSVLAGRYELLDLLDQGSANARFWRACDLVLQRDVALHVIEAGDDRTPSLMAAARASASVAGLHLLRVLDAAVEDDIAYVVAEWGRGVSLDRLVIEHPLPARKAAWMVREVADALVDTHRAGLGHGRLIPENVLVNDNGAVKLIGFAVDKVLHNQSRSAEQDLAADVDALAGLLYAGLTGAWPSGSSAVPAATREHGKVLRPRRTRAGVPRELDVLCDAMLNRPDAPGTPATAMEVRAALSDFLGEAAALPAVDRAALVEENTVAIDMSGLNLDDPDDGTIPTQAASPGPIPEQTSGSPESTVLPAVPLLRTQGPTSSRNSSSRVSRAWPVEDYEEYEEFTGPDAPTEDSSTTRPKALALLRIVGFVAAGLVLVAAVVFAFDLGRNGNDNPAGALDPTASPDPSVTAGPGAAISLASVTDFDPFQDGGKPAEKPDQVPLATDGDPQTAWTTSTYKDGPDLTVYKPGVGLLVDLGQSHQVSQVDLVLQGGPHTLQVLATDSAQPPSDPTQMQVVGRATGAEEKTVIELNEGTRARFVVIWLTGLPPAPGGYRGAIADLQVRG